ncbi:MAG: hypothetical protein LBI69_00455 [Puniceicoccales bacterium]|jgi:BirA family biotin operon repressor/biotin-[acetyl-CoA-carboxylase] ligase|nr:hypothetical protein [Puniceicoccales bacterium]
MVAAMACKSQWKSKEEELQPKWIEEALRRHAFFRRCEWFFFEEVGSTSDWMRKYFSKKTLSDPAIAVARRQTLGHGKGNRRWIGNRSNNIYLTIGFAHRPMSRDLRESAVALAKEISQQFRKKYHIPLCVKCPNDLLLEGKKVAGILVEVPSRGSGWLLSIGMNLFHDPDLQADCAQPVGSMDSVKELSPSKVTVDLCILAWETFFSGGIRRAKYSTE